MSDTSDNQNPPRGFKYRMAIALARMMGLNPDDDPPPDAGYVKERVIPRGSSPAPSTRPSGQAREAEAQSVARPAPPPVVQPEPQNSQPVARFDAQARRARLAREAEEARQRQPASQERGRRPGR